ncbi:hypothetical protein [Streptomyces syringium]
MTAPAGEITAHEDAVRASLAVGGILNADTWRTAGWTVRQLGRPAQP